MTASIALCIDELTSKNPETIGLEGEALGSQDWLEVFSTGAGARKAIAESGAIREAWVVSCDDVEPINLAAAIKADKPETRVCLVAPDACGSLRSRAHNALIDEVLELGAFLRRYADAKGRARGGDRAEAPDAPDAPDAGASPKEQAAPALEGRREPKALMPAPSAAGPAGTRAAHAPQPAPGPRTIAVQAPGRAFIMPVVSGSGGAGKSAVSALGALISHRAGHRTLLLDYDLQFGDVAPMLGVEEPLRVDVAMARPDLLEREVACDGRPAVLAAPARLESADEVALGLPALLESLSQAFDVIVANTGAAWAEQHAALLERSSAALFLVDQRASSVSACRHALELCARCGIATGPFQFALNRCSKGAPLTSTDVSCALQGAPVFELKDGGRDVEDCLSAGAAAELADARNEFAKSLETVMGRILPDAGARHSELRDPAPERRKLRRRNRADRKRGRRRS